MCAGAHSTRDFKMWLLWHQYVFVCALWCGANTVKKPAITVETAHRLWRERQGHAYVTSLGQVANSFHSVYLLPRLPSSSTYSFRLLSDPSDQDPALAPLQHCMSRVVQTAQFATRVDNVTTWEACMFLPEMCRELSVTNMRMPGGADNGNTSLSSDHSHLLERSSSRAQLGGWRTQNQLLRAGAAW